MSTSADEKDCYARFKSDASMTASELEKWLKTGKSAAAGQPWEQRRQQRLPVWRAYYSDSAQEKS